jgi:hypothetical protein
MIFDGVPAANDNDIVVVAHRPLSAIEAPPLAMAKTTPSVGVLASP